jgi:membrane protease YdiL (CAAX protease family)
MTYAPAQPPALWRRVLLFPATRLVLLGGTLLLMLATSNTVMEWFAASPWKDAAVAAAMAALGLTFYVGFVRLVERRSASELALAGMGRELAVGLAIGAGLYTGCVLVLMALGIYRIEGLNPLSFLVPAVAMAITSAIFEELLFRGALFRIVEEWLGSWISLAVSSFVFGFVHLLNPAATLTGAVFISVEAGLLLAAGYMVTRRLWMSMGFHFAWNYTQSAIFSGIVSGGDSDPGLIRPSIDGPALLTGGKFGLEASVVAFVLCTTAGVVLLVLAIRRGPMVPAPWAQPTPTQSSRAASR